MGIVESIKAAKEKGVEDKKILEEIIRQNPQKKANLERALQRGANPGQILEEIIKQNSKKTGDRIEKARERLRMIKEKGGEEIRATAPVPPKKEPEELKKKPEKETSEETKEKPKEKIPPFVRPLPQKPSLKDKLWVRIIIFCLILVTLAGVASFWYWYFRVRPEPHIGCTENAECPEGFTCGPGGVCTEAPLAQECANDSDCQKNFYCQQGICLREEEPGLSPALFGVTEERTLEITDAGEVESLLSQTLQEYQEPGIFKRIIFKNTSEDKYLELKDLLEALQVRISDTFYSYLEKGYTLFIYSQPQGNRLGFAAEVKNKEELENLFSSEEDSLKEGFKPYFALMIEDKPPVVPYFRNADQVPGYTGPNFRYQTLDSNDIGICYLVSNSYFVFSSSFTSTREAAEKLGIPGPLIELNQDLKSGDSGYNVEVLQTWLARDSNNYSNSLVTGYYGTATVQAVTEFQEKYASEILAPQGKVKGTGKAGLYTRLKLNELYGESGAIPSTKEITSDLRYGDSGDEVRLLQKWLAEDPTIYPEGIISGWFGPLTRRAVTRFQEKHSSEILSPQGVTEGSGIVDLLTRKKLNELYRR